MNVFDMPFSRVYACIGGGIGPAIMDALSVEDMSPEETDVICAASGITTVRRRWTAPWTRSSRTPT